MGLLKNWQFSRFSLLAIACLCLPPALAKDTSDTLITAIHQDRTEDAIALLQLGADPSLANRYGVLPLEVACKNGNAALVAALLEVGADAELSAHSEQGGHTPLMTASRTGRPKPIELLITAGAKVNAKDKKRQTSLMWAAVEGHAEAVKVLLAAGADREALLKSGFNAWFFAARQGHSDVIDVLLKDGADVNAVIEDGGGGRSPRDGTSGLILAIENGHFELAAHLLNAGADPNDMRSGYTPLHVLTWVRKPVRGDGIDGAPPPAGSGTVTSLQFVDELIKHGAKVDAQLTRGSSSSNQLARPGSTPFLLAARTADMPFMKLLIEHGADFRLPNKQGRTPLLAATGVVLGPEADEAATHDEAVLAADYLLKLGADISIVDKEGDTVMHAATYKQSPKLVRFLAENGADINIWNRKNSRGWTPLLIAQGFRNGNFKPSDETIAALSEIMLAAGVQPPAAPSRPVIGKKEKYQN
ncbi:MAG: ankyrin repeat protein [Verrucomicrobiales bacterium]|jgi:ankyrin repeat protein